MKKIQAFAAFSLLTLLSAAQAGIVTHSDPQGGGIGYYWTVNLGASDNASASHFVGAWSWEDSTLFSAGQTPVGWTHNSDWVALNLEVPSVVTLRLQSKAGVSLDNPLQPDSVAAFNLKPGMTIYSGWDNDLAPQSFANANNGGTPTDNWHSYSNRGDIVWAEDLKYIAHGNTSGSDFVEVTMLMAAGEYSIAIGGNSSSTSSQPRQGYEMLFTSTPVPEPATGGLLIAGCLGLLARRRRHRA